MNWTIMHGDALSELARLPAGIAQTCVTSPPYYGLRSYGTEPIVWPAVSYAPMPGLPELHFPGDPECAHEWEIGRHNPQPHGDDGVQSSGLQGGKSHQAQTRMGSVESAYCQRCGAWRGNLGLEPTVEMYIAHLVAIFREVRRVLRDDGVVWLNMGDSYSTQRYFKYKALPEKNLMMFPARLALALQADTEPSEWQGAERDKAWLAAVLDCDGYMGIRRQHRSGSDGTNWNDTFIPYVGLGVTDSVLVDRCIAITGYGTKRIKDGPTTDRRGINQQRTRYEWRLDGNKAVEVLRHVYPYLLAKRRQALLIHNLDVSNKSHRPGRIGSVPDDVMEQRAWMYRSVKELNARESVDMPDWVEDVPAEVRKPLWYLRSDVIWAKPNAVPESVSDRPTKSHEHIFLLAKSARYFYDAEAIAEPLAESSIKRIQQPGFWQQKGGEKDYGTTGTNGNRSARRALENLARNPSGKNRRDVWTINTRSFSGSHFATFPPELPDICIRAGTSERGQCPHCGAPWERVVEKRPAENPAGYNGSKFTHGKTAAPRDNVGQGPRYESVGTVGWRPTCGCPEHEPVPQLVIDPFSGAGTTGLVALRLGRRYIGIEPNAEYVRMSERRLVSDAPLFNLPAKVSAEEVV